MKCEQCTVHMTVCTIVRTNTERLIGDRWHMQTRNNSILKSKTILFKDLK